MLSNLHTHTVRCGHAVDTEREYILRAVEGGLQRLGFADHTPYVFAGTDYHSRIRMTPAETADYVATLHALRDEFAGQVDIHVGVEAEYYPKFFAQTVEHLREHDVEYMILGQHFLDNEINAWYNGIPTDDAAKLAQYCDQSIEAMQTGLFTYFAHPDLFRFTGDDKVYTQYIRRLCRAAHDANLPLEINLLGVRENRHYPNPRFWQIAGEEGCCAILGCDAHRAVDVFDPVGEEKGKALAQQYGLTLVDMIPLVPIK